jgi:CRP/FNR family transcriptional regulator, cyclic AMP receptor protein
MGDPEVDRVALLLSCYPFEDLTPAELEPLARAATLRRVVRGEYLHHVGDPAGELYVVVSGQLKDSIVTEDGDEVVHSLYGPGQMIGEAGFFVEEQNRVMAVLALEPARVLVLARAELVPFITQHPQVMMRLLQGLGAIARAQTEMIASLTRRPLRERLLLRLLELAETNAPGERGEGITPKISQSTLAAMVGASREHVNRALAALSAEGALRIEGGRYVMHDPERIREDVSQGWPTISRPNRRIDPAASEHL